MEKILHQLRLVGYPNVYRWCRISSINSIVQKMLLHSNWGIYAFRASSKIVSVFSSQDLSCMELVYWLKPKLEGYQPKHGIPLGISFEGDAEMPISRFWETVSFHMKGWKKHEKNMEMLESNLESQPDSRMKSSQFHRYWMPMTDMKVEMRNKAAITALT